MHGTQYWSISPAGKRPEPVSCGIPVGIADDTAYLGLAAKLAIRGVMAVPLSVGANTDMEEWRNETLHHLVASKDLRFISVWNPSFLTLLMDHLPDIVATERHWPDLKLISCWSSGAAEKFIPALKERFPGIEIQGKGLLATEGVVSIPISGHQAPTPAITSHFLEFIDAQGKIFLVDELVIGTRYKVIMTTSSGFARYELGDEIEVVAPMAIEFVGRGNSVSDLCGEKLSEAFVNRVLEKVASQSGFAMLAPEWGEPPKYLLFTESGNAEEEARVIEKKLMSSTHYNYCRRLGQLDPVEAVEVTDGADKYLRSCVTMGQRYGDVKPTGLRVDFGWRDRMLSYDNV